LDIGGKFGEIVDQAHCVLLAGGTMHPVEDVIAQLFVQRPVSTFSCGHVIPKTNLKVLQISKSPAGSDLRFTHGHDLFEDLNASLRNLCAVSPVRLFIC
jgi:chromosome transmission fidelity protein 1